MTDKISNDTLFTMKQAELSPQQEAVLNFITEHYHQNGVAPSYRDIQSHFGFKAVGTVQDHVKALIQKGRIEKPLKKARGLIPCGQKLQGSKRLSVYGEVAAGGLRTSEQLELGSIIISETLAQGECFALRVVGNSMVDVGIYEGDHVVVQKGARVKNGDIVVALVEGETTVKRFEKKGVEIFLVPENKRMSPINITGKNCEIQGKVIALQRKM